ncbi:unnamed protein product [Cuscuta europaea]|uniref:Uncharacterized protein n=1 Tax=Cuscuta europaea TaxID=41803 RepID=A0A9P1DXG0_CUSEU|nr:unnamed protein product [Cuscuta europaea]
MWPRTAYAMDDFGAFLDDGHSLGLLENPKTKKDLRALFVLLKKLLVPIFLVATVFVNWGHPLIIAAKVTLILYTTKSSSVSIYLFVEENQPMQLLQPELHKFQQNQPNQPIFVLPNGL